MSDVKWIKVTTDIFDDEKILLIESMPEADTLIVIWFKLLTLAGKQNNNGVFTIRDSFPYTDEMFATIFRRPLNTVRMALDVFEKFGMVDIINHTVTIPNWNKHQQLDKLEMAKEQTRLRVERHRGKQKMIAEGSNAGCNVTVTLPSVTDNVTVTECNGDRVDIDKNRIDKDKSISVRHKYGQYQNVLLSDDDFAKVKAEFPNDWQARIEKLSEYMASTGKSYKSHLATIRAWSKNERGRTLPKGYTERPASEQHNDELVVDFDKLFAGGND